MINYREARDLMPSVQASRERTKVKLSEIEGLICNAAKSNKEAIQIYIYNYESPDVIIRTLSREGFCIDPVGNMSIEHNDNISRRLYEISWR